MFMELKRGLRKSILLPALTYGSETWTQNGAQQSSKCALELSCLKEHTWIIKIGQ